LKSNADWIRGFHRCERERNQSCPYLETERFPPDIFALYSGPTGQRPFDLSTKLSDGWIFVREYGLTHARITPEYPQSNRKVELLANNVKGQGQHRNTLPNGMGSMKKLEDCP
jgi:hypothetical protein